MHDIAGWHTELYVDGRDLPELEPRLARLSRLSVDHLGMHRDGLASLLRLVARGARVKATGFGRVELDVPHRAARDRARRPDGPLFGTDLPSTRARRPFALADVDTLREALGPEDAERALLHNARSWYRIDSRDARC